jgi:hypothetical protein
MCRQPLNLPYGSGQYAGEGVFNIANIYDHRLPFPFTANARASGQPINNACVGKCPRNADYTVRRETPEKDCHIPRALQCMEREYLQALGERSSCRASISGAYFAARRYLRPHCNHAIAFLAIISKRYYRPAQFGVS